MGPVPRNPGCMYLRSHKRFPTVRVAPLFIIVAVDCYVGRKGSNSLCGVKANLVKSDLKLHQRERRHVEHVDRDG